MNLKIKKQITKKMLYDLFLEESGGGFNEYAQFCEEELRSMIDTFSHKQIDNFIRTIERTSVLRIDRKKYKDQM
jgi:hypothetical protein